MISANDFARVEELFADSTDLSPEERAERLGSALADRPDLRDAVDALLAAHDRVSAAAGPEPPSHRVFTGTRLGHYLLGEKVGEGGMGEVFRAERVDGAFTQTVAVKVTRAVGYREELIRRFKNERQILASLHHPNIVRLLDGGATDDGHMYFVMEYIQGVPLTHYCREHSLGFEQRLHLFRAVCTAVQYAHQHGVVHRDLKPANILVLAEGVPKVLDFGLAKLLNVPAHDGTTTVGPMPAPLTPNYASPEQLRGLPVTTASDVYGLGVLLYELLTGARPYETQGQTLDRVVDLVLHHEPPRLSNAVNAASVPYPIRHLRGDIEAVVSKAMNKEPAARYDSAGELGSDLSRVLDGAPVMARPLTTGYMLQRLAGRHKALVTVVALALVAVLVASGMALWQRTVARREQARAEALFKDVRQLASSLIFKVHDAVVPLPGSTEVRRTIVNDAIGYLERLEAQSSGDLALRLELAAAYRQIAGILGDPQNPNLGDRDGALRQYERARVIAASVAGVNRTYEATASLALTDQQLSTLYGLKGDRPRALGIAREAVAYATEYQQRYPADPRGPQLVAESNFRLAWASTPVDSIPVWQQTLAYYESVLRTTPDAARAQRNVALMSKYLAQVLDAVERRDEALPHFRRAVDLDEKRLHAAPDNRLVQFDAAISYAGLAVALENKGEFAEAAALFEQSLALRRRVVEADPKDVQARERLGVGLSTMVRIERKRGNLSRAREYGREAASIQAAVVERTGDNSAKLALANIWFEIAEVEDEAGHATASCQAFRRAHEGLKGVESILQTRETGRLKHAIERSAGCASAVK
jgi:tetratricopeptide (TPR) repeat protein